ncbi:MAG TPA: hypothetical protein VGF95_12810 [Solirubrobacteraceae bacterium]
MAGTYDVYSCRIPYGASAGAAAPLEVAEGGEAPGEWNAKATGKVTYSDTCASGGGLTAGLPAEEEHGATDVLTWQFSAPTGETIKEATLWRAGDADGGTGYLYWMTGPEYVPAAEALTSKYFFEGCVYQLGCTEGQGNPDDPLASENEFKVPYENLGGPHLYLSVTCSMVSCPNEPGDTEGFATVINLYASDMLLQETALPSVTNVTGALATQEPIAGEASLAFQAQDQGSGVYQQVVEVDGNQIQRSIVDEAEGRCKPLEAGTEPLAFLYPRPCPATVQGHVTLDTSTLTDGTHQLRIAVTNAAGNTSTVLERQIDVANHAGESGEHGQDGSPPPTGGTQVPSEGTSAAPNGSPASATATLTAHWATGKAHRSGSSGASVTAAYGHAQTIDGRLTGPGGKPIAGALIGVTARATYGGAKPKAMHAARTGKAGAFALKLPSKDSSSQAVELSYADTIGGKPVAVKTLTLHVKAGVQLHVTPTTTAAGKAIALSGRVLGGPIPQGGKQVVLEARSKGTRWLQFKVLHTGRDGRFHASHRFRLPGPIRYRFRAICPHEADFPFLAGGSKAVGVFER